MRISANSGAAHLPHVDNSKTQAETLKKKQVKETEVVASENSEQQSNEKEKGVIRNLLDGHYKGVADIRLRINFFDELSSIEENARISSFQNALPDFQNTLDSSFSRLLENQDLDEQQLEQITNKKNSLDLTLKDLTGQGMSSGELFNIVETETNTFLDTIQSVLESAKNISIEPEESAESVAQSTNPLSEFMDQVNGALTTLKNDGLSITVLPELSEPSGNGVAYEKFLAIYQELQGIGNITETDQNASVIDVEA
jgi:hypothetical protein